MAKKPRTEVDMNTETYSAKKQTDEIDDERIAKELVDKMGSMVEDMKKKLETAKEQLLKKLDVLSDKYRTANGIKAAMDAIYSLVPPNSGANAYDVMTDARAIAEHLSDKCHALHKMASQLDFASLRNLTHGMYDDDMVNRKDLLVTDLAEELMVLELLSNVGPNADDISDFYDRAMEEIGAVGDQLEEMLKDHPEFESLVTDKVVEITDKR